MSRSYMEERERTENERHSAERRLDDVVAQFCRLVYIDASTSGQTSVGLLEHVLRKVNNLFAALIIPNGTVCYVRYSCACV